MKDYILAAIPVLIAAIIYFVRIEVRLTKISSDVGWIKKVIDSRRKPREEKNG